VTRDEAIEAIDRHTGGKFAIRCTGKADGAWHAEVIDPKTNKVVAFAFVEDHGRVPPYVDWY
jgi:hypothetical protein